MKAIYLRKRFFESSAKFEDRVNSHIRFIAAECKDLELSGMCIGDNYVVIYCATIENETEIKENTVVTGFKK